MADEALVTIVVPAYNHARYLGECIDSVLNQTYPSVELIVIDDGSTDDTRMVLERYRGAFHWESQANMGQSATLNRGWDMSRGTILGYLSADDLLHPDAVRTAMALFRARPDIVAAYPDFNLVDQHSKIVRRIAAPEFDRRDLVIDLVCQPGPGALFRRSAWQRSGPWNPEFRQNPDLDFWMRLALQGDFCRIPAPLASFRVHEASQTYRRADAARASEPIRIVDKLLSRSDLPAWVTQDSQRARSNAQLASAQIHLSAGRLGHALKAIAIALRLSPSRVFSLRTGRMLASALLSRKIFQIRTFRAHRALE